VLCAERIVRSAFVPLAARTAHRAGWQCQWRAVSLLVYEAKATPSSFDVNGLTKRGLLLKLILASPDDYETKPPEVKQQLEKFRDVRLVLSGYHFKEQVVIACAKPDPPIWIFRTVPARPLASKAPLAFEGTSDAESRRTGASKFVI
jgi:hypothetical protein